jgi:hypothetical protein
MGLGSGIRKKTYSGSRIRVQGSKGTGSQIRTRNTAFIQVASTGFGPGTAEYYGAFWNYCRTNKI